jgi:FKBP-type peptidyl-prolyl cis-trans isomerase 2
MQKEKMALIALVIIVIAALSVFLIAVNTNIFENLFKEKVILSEGDCADVNYIGRYASNNTIFDTSYTYPENKSGGTPLKVFITNDTNATSPKAGYTAGIIEGFREGLIGMEEGQSKIIGPIPPEKAYGKNKLTEGAIFTTQYLAFGMNQTVIVTNYTSENLSLKWIQMENLGNFTMPQLVIKNLQSENETEMIVYPPPYYIWKNATSIINITDTNVTVRTTPTKSTNLSKVVTPVQYGEKQMMIFPNSTTAIWNDTKITVVCSPIIGQNYTFPYESSAGIVNYTIHINNITGDKINVTITNDQNTEPAYLDLYKTFTFNRTFVLPRLYKDIPSMYISYFYAEEIQKAGYSIEPLAGESLTFEVTVEKVYKTSQETS